MVRVFPSVAVSGAVTVALFLAMGWSFAAETAAPSGGDGSDRLIALRVEPTSKPPGIVMRGRNSRQQLVVTGEYSSGQLRDLTRRAHYSSAPSGVVAIDESGFVTPLEDGEAVIDVRGDRSLSASVRVQVEGVRHPDPINFKHQIVPIFTKLGCSGGGCHGKASGQNGFRLSLLGFYPEDDYEFLVKESRGRRLFPSAPGESLILQKALGHMHGGGKRLDENSYEYRMIYQWIEQSMPYGSPDDPTIVAIRCQPEHRIMERHADQQITTTAVYSDGSTEDVTRMAVYEANDSEMAEVTGSGLVKTRDLFGQVTVMARYRGQVSTFRATIPQGTLVDNLPPSRNLVDRAVFDQLTALGIPPSPRCDDATFLRRASIDITGSLPSESAVREFLADKTPGKRDRLVDSLVDGVGYANWFANKWNMILRNKKRSGEDLSGTLAFYRWIWSSLYENKPYDQFVRQIVTAAGDMRSNPAVVWYREVDESTEQVEDVAQLFLGLRIQCARCHHHPYEKWSQDDYYALSAFFSRVGKKKMSQAVPKARDRRVFHNEGVAQARNPRTGANLPPAALDSPPLQIPPDRDPRVRLADWMVAPDNPFFARALVNRYWKHFFNRGIVEPEDDMRETNPPSNPELLEALSRHFVASGYDLKELVRTICKSETYQRSSYPDDKNANDKQNFSRYYPKRLTAEVLYDAVHQVTGASQSYNGMPAGTTAVQLADSTAAPYFLTVFGQPQASTACECERLQDANLAQRLHLLNSAEIQTMIAADNGRAARLATQQDRSHDQRVRELYRWVFAREPSDDELKCALGYISTHASNTRAAYEDLGWALINTREFLFNH